MVRAYHFSFVEKVNEKLTNISTLHETINKALINVSIDIL